MEDGPAIRVLGPVEVRGPAGAAELIGPRQRALVAVLALDSGTVISQARLVDALWGDDPPRTAVRTLQSHIARVRAAFDACGLPGVVRTRDPGYVLDLPAAAIDIRRAAALAKAGDAGSLAAAIDLWCGDPLSDVGDGDWVTAERERIGELRLSLAERLWEVRLGGAEQEGAVAELERLVRGAPTRERLVGLLMRALYLSGRHTEALDRFERLRSNLSEELGVDPSAELRRLHEAILRQDPVLETSPAAGIPAPTPVPSAPTVAVARELPAPGGHFTGRRTEAERLRSGGARVRMIVGQGGVGKTALALQWAHEVKESYPDAHLFLDLRGHDPDLALTPADVLSHALRGLGVAPDQIPASVPDQLARYRTLIDARRVLIVLDNAGTADHVLPLVPPTSSSALVVTSRRRLTAMALHHDVRSIELDVLPAEDAVTLLTRIIGTERVSAERDAVESLTIACDRLPLALRIAAARLAARPRQRVADFVEELAEDVLDGLEIEGDARSIRSVFASAYNALSEPAAQLFGLLGHHPGPTFTNHLAAAAADRPLGRVRRSLDELAAAHLVAEVSSGRYRFHDLLRVFAREYAQESPTGAGAIIAWHLTVAATANQALSPARNRIQPNRTGSAPFPDDPIAAMSFMDDERLNHLPVVELAANLDPDRACSLVYLLAGYYSRRCYVGERIALGRAGVAAGRAVADGGELEGLMLSGLGVAHIAAHQYPQAIEVLGDALARTHAGGNRGDEGYVHNNLAVAYCGLERYAEAADAFEQALALAVDPDRIAEAQALNNIGFVRTLAGGDGVPALRRALELATAAQYHSLRAEALDGLGHAFRHRDDATALDYLLQAVAAFRDLDDHARIPDVLTTTGQVLLDLGEVRRARSCLIEALTLCRAAGDEHTERAVLEHLARTDEVPVTAVGAG